MDWTKKEAKMRRRRRANALGVKVQTSEITFSLPPRAFTFAVHIHVHISPVHDQSPWFVSLTIPITDSPYLAMTDRFEH